MKTDTQDGLSVGDRFNRIRDLIPNTRVVASGVTRKGSPFSGEFQQATSTGIKIVFNEDEEGFVPMEEVAQIRFTTSAEMNNHPY